MPQDQTPLSDTPAGPRAGAGADAGPPGAGGVPAHTSAAPGTHDHRDSREWLHSLLIAQNELLAEAAGGAPIDSVLGLVVRAARQHLGAHSRAAMFVVDPDGASLRFAATDGMPETYTRAVDGFKIGPDSPSCGTAAFTGRTVVVRDVTTDPLWAPYLGLAKEHDIRACWSEPMRTLGGKVLGTLALYFSTPREPGPGDLDAIRLLSQTAAVLIDRHRELAHRKRTDEAVRDSEERLRLALEAADMGTWREDLATGLGTRDASLNVLFGFDPLLSTQLINDRFRLIVDEDRSAAVAAWQKAVEGGGAYKNTFRIRRDDGSVRWIAEKGRVKLDAGGKATSVTGVSRDITEKTELRAAINESEVRYRRLFQTAKDGILILDAQTGKIIDANAFMSGLLGQDLPQLLGKELWEIGMFADIAHNKAAFKELQDSGYVRYDHLPVQNPNGQTTQVEFVSNVYREGERLVAQCNVRDITARVWMEQKIKLQTEALADQARHKDEFLAMLSHELRNPLAPIRSATHLLRLQERGSENPIQQQAREVIERQVANLTRLVSDLMEVSRALTGRIRLELETVDVNQTVRHAIETALPLIEKRGHALATAFTPDPIWARIDSTRIEEVFVNLLVNAAKYTSDGGRIEIACEHHPNHALVRIRDNGAGIEPALLPRIFDLFTQADRTLDRAQGGLGIGLSLAHRVIELHGGTIEARSEGAGKGSEFIVRLQLAPAPGVVAPAPAPDEATPTVRHGVRVLVVDDNVDACLMLANLLRLRGHGVSVAHTGTAALAAAKSWRPDLVLLDIGLPEVDGYEIARRLRADPATRTVKLIAVTGYGAEKDVHLGLEAGFNAHLLKPADLVEVERLLAGWQGTMASGSPAR